LDVQEEKDPPSTPWTINMEPTNYPFRKENVFLNLHEDMFHVNLQGCIARIGGMNQTLSLPWDILGYIGVITHLSTIY